MTAISRLRQAYKNLAGRLVGTRAEVPVHFVRQVDTVGKMSDIRALPLNAACPNQIMDNTAPDFGDFWFTPGYDIPGTKRIKPAGTC